MYSLPLLVFVALVPFENQAAGARAKDLIVGKWQAADDKEQAILEFHPDGKLSVSIAGLKLDGKYRFLAEAEMEGEMSVPGAKESLKERLRVKVTKDELTTSDSKDKVDRFKQVK
jgi:uncharacterized protein (TIGR03066 family)